MTMRLEVEGQEWENFVSTNVQLRLDALSNTFSFQSTSKDNQPLPFQGGESCRVIVDDDPVLTGSIEVINVTYSANDVNITIEGRDKTADLLDSTLESISDLRPPISLKQIIEKVLQQLGLDIKVIELTTTDIFNTAEDLVSPEPAQNAFDFIEKYARKRQVLLTSDGNGNIVITQAQGTQSGGRIQHIIGADNNNVISASASYDTTGRFNVYKFTSSLNPVALVNAGVTDLATVVNQSGRAIDRDIRTSRQMILVAESPFSDSQSELRATWEANIRKARGRVYSPVVSGFKNQSGNLWNVNQLVPIVDERAGINAQMLINSVQFNFDLQTGSQTTLGFVERNAYSLALSEPQTEKIADGIFS